MQLAVCLCIYITKDHTQRGVQGQVCTLSAIGEGEGFGDGLCLSMKLPSNFLTQHQHWKFPSSKAQQSKPFLQSAFSKAQHQRPLQGSAFQSLHQSLSKAQHFQAFSRLSIESGLLCLVCKRDFLEVCFV